MGSARVTFWKAPYRSKPPYDMVLCVVEMREPYMHSWIQFSYRGGDASFARVTHSPVAVGFCSECGKLYSKMRDYELPCDCYELEW